MWIDELGKRVDPIETNFAGKYYLGLHSCGAGCRYYSLTNMVDGKDLSGILDRFTSNPDEKKITLFKLFYNEYSQLFIVRYFKDSYATDYQECLFLIKNDKLNNINNCSK